MAGTVLQERSIETLSARPRTNGHADSSYAPHGQAVRDMQPHSPCSGAQAGAASAARMQAQRGDPGTPRQRGAGCGECTGEGAGRQARAHIPSGRILCRAPMQAPLLASLRLASIKFKKAIQHHRAIQSVVMHCDQTIQGSAPVVVSLAAVAPDSTGPVRAQPGPSVEPALGGSHCGVGLGSVPGSRRLALCDQQKQARRGASCSPCSHCGFMPCLTSERPLRTEVSRDCRSCRRIRARRASSSPSQTAAWQTCSSAWT